VTQDRKVILATGKYRKLRREGISKKHKRVHPKLKSAKRFFKEPPCTAVRGGKETPSKTGGEVCGSPIKERRGSKTPGGGELPIKIILIGKKLTQKESKLGKALRLRGGSLRGVALEGGQLSIKKLGQRIQIKLRGVLKEK